MSAWKPVSTSAVATLLLLGCSTPLEPNDIVGTYVATRLTFSGAESGDFLAAGGSIQLTLAGDFTTSGTMVTPASLSESGAVETVDLAGQWSLENEVVSFVHPNADTFIRDTDWEFADEALRAMPTFDGTTLDVVLTRQ